MGDWSTLSCLSLLRLLFLARSGLGVSGGFSDLLNSNNQQPHQQSTQSLTEVNEITNKG